MAAAAPLAAAEPPPDVSAWVVEWHFDAGLEEARQGGAFSSLQLFAASFDADDRLVLPEAWARYQWTATGPVKPLPADAEEATDDGMGNIPEAPVAISPGEVRPPLFLTVVNDRPGMLKDPDLISRLLATPTSRRRHGEALLALLKTYPFAGLELDYERVHDRDWAAYLDWVREFHAELRTAGYALRVVLEPQRRFFELPFPRGPDYVVMAYNLHGGHSGPGPKADTDFLRRLGRQCAGMTPRPRLAFANGGYVWEKGQRTRGITENDAARMAETAGITPRRDTNSGALHYTCPATEDSGAREVWFADAQTLKRWTSLARVAGFSRFALWRLGGNQPESVAAGLFAGGEEK